MPLFPQEDQTRDLSFDERVARAEAALAVQRTALEDALLDTLRKFDLTLDGWTGDGADVPQMRQACLEIAHDLKGLAGVAGHPDVPVLCRILYESLQGTAATRDTNLAPIRQMSDRIKSLLHSAV